MHKQISKLLKQKNQRILTVVVWVMLLISLPVQAQTCNNAITSSAPDSRYTDNGDGTVTDKQTSLMWKQCAESQSGPACATATAARFTWDSALQQPETVNTTGGFAGHTNWRLPNIKELSTLVERACYAPSINITIFPATPSSNFWSSTPGAYSLGGAFYINFTYGDINGAPRYYDYFQVRLVRSGQ